jgi:transposase
LAAIGFRLLAPHRRDRKRPSRNDGWRMRRHRRRFVVERTFGRLHGYRRLLLRHEWDAHLSDGLLRPACALIAVGKF